MTGHPKIDPVTGELLFFGYDFGPVHLRYHRVAPTARSVAQASISRPRRPTMMHDFGVTETRVVFMDLPVVLRSGIGGAWLQACRSAGTMSTGARLG